jgi:spore maturation protein CgeB
VPSSDIKIFLVSDATGFAISDVYHGYANALRDLKVPFDEFPFHLFRKLISDEISYNVIHSMSLIKSNGFTHTMFIGGTRNVPDFILESLYGVKSVVVATEDPHSFDPNKHRLDSIDYYFTNERSIAHSGRYKNVFYCPTAACSRECGVTPREHVDEKYHSDILFLGALYPNRQKVLESLVPLVEKAGLSFKICGHVGYMKKANPLWKYVFDPRTVPHNETVKYYNGAKAVVNILRDVRWNPRTKSGKNPLNRSKFAPESLNPRAYEVPMCGALQFIDDDRPESREIFTDKEVVFYSSPEELAKKMEVFLLHKTQEERRDMIISAFQKVSCAHTYTHRLQGILKVLRSCHT